MVLVASLTHLVIILFLHRAPVTARDIMIGAYASLAMLEFQGPAFAASGGRHTGFAAFNGHKEKARSRGCGRAFLFLRLLRCANLTAPKMAASSDLHHST